MQRADWRDPLLLSFVGLGVLLLPVLALLAEAYPSYEERVRRAAGPRQMAPFPSEARIVEQVREVTPATDGLVWKPVYQTEEEPYIGIARSYDLIRGEESVYFLILFRHDIACDICRDLRAGVLYEWATDTWTQILLFEPFEQKGSLVDARPFLTQFLGQPVSTRFVLGENVDGITGATRSVKALIHRLHEVADWLVVHREDKTTLRRGEEAGL